MGEHIYESGTYMITLRLPDEAIEDIGQSGQNDEAVAHWHGKLADQFTTIDREKLIAELLEYGCWDEAELRSDPELTEQRFLWLAAWDLHDQNYGEQQENQYAAD
jgi:hypothetical protein